MIGVHDLSQRAKTLFNEKETKGWFVDAVAIGHDPTQTGGADYSHWLPHNVICRLNNDWHPGGTIPLPEHYSDFAIRCANYVQNSQGCHIWIIGNEPNLSIERPYERSITPADYIACYKLCYNAIKAVAPDDWVVPAAIGPWNVQTGDWLGYYQSVLSQVRADALCWHLYTHGTDPALVTSDDKMGPPYADRFYHFRAWKDFAAWTPSTKQDLPILITEANQNDPWEATGWIPAALEETKRINRDVRCLCLYRACVSSDTRSFENKDNVWDELGRAMEGEEPMPDEWSQVYWNAMERGSYDQGGKPEFTLPKGLEVYYLHDPDNESENNEPEMDIKDAEQHPEVYEGRFSGNGFYLYSTGVFWVVTEQIFVQNNRPVRGSAHHMHVYNNSSGGARFGIVDGDGPFSDQYAFPPSQLEAINAAVTWGDWRSSYDGTPNRQWYALSTPELTPTQGHVRLVLQFTSDFAGGGHSHFDTFKAEQKIGSEPPPPTGDIDYERIDRIIRDALEGIAISVHTPD